MSDSYVVSGAERMQILTNSGLVDVHRNYPYTITSSVTPNWLPRTTVFEDPVPEYEETLWALPWDIPVAPSPPRGFEKLPTPEMFS
jgi:hypothetical protein